MREEEDVETKREFESVTLEGEEFREMGMEIWPFRWAGIEMNVAVSAIVPEKKRRELYAKLSDTLDALVAPVVEEWAKGVKVKYRKESYPVAESQ